MDLMHKLFRSTSASTNAPPKITLCMHDESEEETERWDTHTVNTN